MKRLGAIGLAVLLVGCTEKNPLYCDHDGDCQSGSCDKQIHTCDLVVGDGGTDGPPPMHCTIDMNCPTTQPHCMDGICRECVTSSDCTGGKVCEMDHTCGPCTSDMQCSFAGAACEDGMCPPASDVAWPSLQCSNTSFCCGLLLGPLQFSHRVNRPRRKGSVRRIARSRCRLANQFE